MAKVELDVDLELGASTGEDAEDEMDNHYSGRSDINVDAAIRRMSGSSVSLSTSVPTYIAFTPEAPPTGRALDVRRITLSSSDPLADATGLPVVVLVSARPPRQGEPIDPRSVVDFASSIPVALSYGTGALVLQENERLYVAFQGDDTTTQYIATARGVEMAQTRVADMRP